jgi:hypothetical protein
MSPRDSKEVFQQSLMQALLVRYYEPPEDIPTILRELVTRLDEQSY